MTRALLVLTFTTGVIDAASYLGLGHVFTANMTGNIVLPRCSPWSSTSRPTGYRVTW